MTLASWDVSLYDTMLVHTKLPIINKPRPPFLTSRRVCALACDLDEDCVHFNLIHTSGNLDISIVKLQV